MRALDLTFLLSLALAGCGGIAVLPPPDPAPAEDLCPAGPDEPWTLGIGALPPAEATLVAVAPDGDVFVGAEAQQPVDLGGGPIDAFFVLARLDPAGALRWARGFSPKQTSFSRIAAAADGSVAVAGTSRSSAIDLGGGALGAKFNDHEETFLGVFDPDGEHVASLRLGTEEVDGFADPFALRRTADGGVLLSIGFSGTLVVGGEAFASGAGSFGYDGLVVRFDAAGTPLWARQLVGLGESSTAAVDQLHVTASGRVLGLGRVHGGFTLGVADVVSAGQTDGVAFALDGDTGEPLWVTPFGGAATEAFVGGAVDGEGLTVLCTYGGAVEGLPPTDEQATCVARLDGSGALTGAAATDLGGGAREVAPGPDATLVAVTADGGGDSFRLVWLDGAGALLGARTFTAEPGPAGPVGLEARAVAATPCGQAIAVGKVRGEVDFGAGPLLATTGETPFGQRAFVAKVDLVAP